MSVTSFPLDEAVIRGNVSLALAEDLGSGDINAALIPIEARSSARLIAREPGILAGQPWVQAIFSVLDDPSVTLTWHCQDGQAFVADQVLCELSGCSRTLLSAERVMLNYLQTLSGTATTTHHYVALLRAAGSDTQLLDTRKTLPGLRLAQKYAVHCGGGTNHRFGLYDAYLIKENHILACGSISEALTQARAQHPKCQLEIEVENFTELTEALSCRPDIIMLDNFSVADIRQAVSQAAGRVKLEVSGNIDEQHLSDLAGLGVDYISSGALTKHVRAIDLSMRFEAL